MVHLQTPNPKNPKSNADVGGKNIKAIIGEILRQNGGMDAAIVV